jgi:hypothetical protein
MEWAGHVACMGEKKEVYKFLVGKHQGKRPIEKQAYIGEMDQNGSYVNWLECVEWIYLDQDRDRWRALVNMVINLRILVPRS